MRRQKKKKEAKLELEEINLRKMSKKDSESTMEARLSEALQITSLSSKIAEMYDPNKLKQFSLDQIEYISDLGGRSIRDWSLKVCDFIVTIKHG